jgi:pilus assembly protein FimV
VVRRSISIVAALAVVALAGATAVHAAGLGRLTVLSALGQPLVAEIEIVSLQPGEEEGLSARLAPIEAFQQAGVDINPALNSVRIAIDRREKRPFLRVTSTQPVSEPFLDMLVELQWSSGRLVREYTFLLDPPEYRSRQQAIASTPLPPMAAEKPAATPEEKPAQPAAEPAPPATNASEAAATPAPAAAEAAPSAATPASPASPAPPAAAAAAPAKPAAANAYEVKRGDTLGTIARQHLTPGVSLNQMLIAIFRANEDAFIRGNVNLVRTGKILNIPEPEGIGSIDAEEANRLVKEHHDQFMEYRSRLAAVPARAETAEGQREASGRIEQKPEAPKPPAPGDQVRLSKGEPSKPAAASSRAAREDDAAARERALAEAQSRIAELERNIADQKKLLEMRNQQLNELQNRGASKPAPQPPVAQAPTPAPAPAAKAPEKPAAQAPAAPAPATAPPSAAAEAPKPAPEAPKPAAEAPKPAAEAPKPPAAPAKPVAKKAPPPPEPSLLDEFIDPLYLGALGLLLFLLVLYGAWRWRRKKRAQAKFQDSVGAAAASGSEALGAATSPASTTSTQTASQAPAGMEAEEVDPIAEADVYMAYGRDAQAEEILREALQKDANRVAVHGKLLEIYAHRKDTQAFEQTALKLKNLTKGAGPEWERAASLGRSVDPANGLYGAGPSVGAAPSAPPAAGPSAPVLDFDLGGASQSAAATPDISLDEPAKEISATGLDLDLGATQTTKLPVAPDDTVVETRGEKSGDGGLDFNLDLGTEQKKPGAAKPGAAASPEASGLDFDLNLDLDKSDSTKADAAKVDLSEISLDLDNVPGEASAGVKASTDPKWQEVATKLDLAKAYEEMGDKDGARELLKEVMKDGDAAQRGSAEQLLAKLG